MYLILHDSNPSEWVCLILVEFNVNACTVHTSINHTVFECAYDV